MPTPDANPIATAIIYEDDEVRVWNQVIGPGETLGRHTHEHDYFLVTVRADGPLDVEFHDGTGGRLGERIEFSAKRGDAAFIPKGHVETAHNPGGEYRAILVELKRD